MINQEEQQALSLAATVQALSLVNDVAAEGKFDAQLATPVLQALVNYSPEDVLSAYGGNIHGLQYGISELKKLFSETLNRDITQYLMSVIGIELKLVRNTPMRNLLQSELQRLSHQLNHTSQTESVDFDDEDDTFEPSLNTNHQEVLTQDAFIGEFAQLYKQTASQTEPRIMVKGNHQFLQQESSANQIRALLLAALRGAAFFRHYGGKRFDLMMKRNQYIEILNAL